MKTRERGIGGQPINQRPSKRDFGYLRQGGTYEGGGVNSKTNFTRLFYFLRRRVSDDDETRPTNSARKLCENLIGTPRVCQCFGSLF